VPAEARLALALPRLPEEPRAASPTAHQTRATTTSGEPADAPVAVSPSGSSSEGLPLDVWWRGQAAFIDGPGARRLREEVDARWQSLAAGEARGAIGPFVLLEIESTGGRRGGTPTELRLDTLRPGTATPRRTTRLHPNGDGLFDVTDLVG
jgi:hypothetical protein